MIDSSAKRIPPTRWRCSRQRIDAGVAARFACEVNSNGCAGLRVFGVISPGIDGGFVGDLSRLQRNGWVPGAVEPLWTLQADSNAPVGVVAERQEKGRMMLRLRCRRAHWRILLG